ncbi:MAG: hypothetical protein HYT11_00905, partial [Candidatus Levybacteria bacterium]|nr:hypothetical protein [Candidatus Levybacteria bacterium]
MKKKPLLILLAVIAVIGIGSYIVMQQGSLPIPGISPTLRATEKDFAFIQDATIRKHFVAQANQTKYRTKSYSTGADLNFLTETEIKGENFNIRNIEYDPSGKETKHRVEIGNTIYVKDYSDNAWWKQTIVPEEIPAEEKPEEPVDFKEEYAQPSLNFKFITKEPCGAQFPGSTTCFKYEQTDNANQEMYTLRTFWFDDNKYLLRKEES